MAECTIQIYKTGLKSSMNALIENIEGFLLTKPSSTFNDVQYFKNALTAQIKLNITQALEDVMQFDYLRVLNTNRRAFYYFIDKTRSVSQSTIAFDLVLDTINTFQNIPFTKKTYVEREHRDRFLHKYESGGYTILVRNIDKVLEGLNPSKYMIADNPFHYSNEEGALPTKWTMFYKSLEDVNADSTNAIRLTCQPSVDMPIGYIDSEVTIDPTKSYAIYWGNLTTALGNGQNKESDSIVFMDGNGNKKEVSFSFFDYHKGSLTQRRYGIMISYNPNTNYYSPVYYDKNGVLQKYIKYYIGFVPTKILFRSAYYYTANTPTATYETTWTGNSIGSVEQKYIKNAKSIDRTDSTLAKIIALPYAPFEIQKDSNGSLIMPSGFYFSEDGLLYCDDPNIQFESTIRNWEFPDLKVALGLITPITTITGNEAREDLFESKMYHSEFYSDTIVYDSFIKEIAMERLKVTDNEASHYYFPIKFRVTNSMNSKFAFKVDIYGNEYAMNYDKMGAFDEYLVIERNNEQAIYNNNYLNYLRVGYNYDKKQVTQNMFQSAASGAMSVASNVARGAISGNYVGAAIGAGSSLIGTITNAISQQQAFEQKQIELKAQSVSVVGSNDVDILEYYNGNILHHVIYRVSDDMKAHIQNLFYYFGYATRKLKVPSTNTRYWFNYVKCSPVFDTTSYMIDKAYLEDIENRYLEGVTIYHTHNNQWDLAQVKENWETWLVG